MMSFYKNRILFFTGVVLSFLFIVHPVYAMTVSPVVFDFEIAPGNSVQERIRLLNDTNEELRFSLFAENFIAQGEDGGQAYASQEHSSDLASWIRPSAPSVMLRPGEAKEFPFLISVPSSAEPGGHYATIFFSRSGESGSASGVGISEEIGVLVLVRVTGNIQEQASVESFRLIPNALLNRLPARFELRVRNTGSVHFRPKGIVTVKNVLGYTVGKIPINPDNVAVLPSSVRRITSTWIKKELVEEGFFAGLVNEWRNFAIGPYTATLEATYGSRNMSLEEQHVTFWVWPWRVLLSFLFIVVIIISIVHGYNKMLIRSVLKKRN